MKVHIGLALLAGLGGAAVTTAAADGINSINLAGLKAIFDNRQIPNTLEKSGEGVQFVQAKVGNQYILVAPINCPGKDQTAACTGVLLLSAAWGIKPTSDQLLSYATSGIFYASPIAVASGEPILRYVFDVGEGVGPSYVENRMKRFYDEEGAFEAYLMTLQSPSGAPKTGGGFATEKGANGLKGDIGKTVNLSAAASTSSISGSTDFGK